MAGQPDAQRTEWLLNEVGPAIRAIIKRKLRITLDPADGRRENQNGLELYGDVWVKLLQEMDSDAIRSARSYASVIAYHACAEYFRDKYPARTSLRNRIQYFLEHHPEYDVWQSDDGDLVAGFAFWRDKKIDLAPAEKLSGLAPEGGAKPVGRMKPKDWDTLFDSIFQTLAAPAEFDGLVNAVAPLVDSVDAVEGGKTREDEGGGDGMVTIPSPELRADAKLWVRLRLQRLWIEILQLQPRQRFAYLLNPTDGELDVFPENGIAGIVEIGRSLALSSAQFELLAGELGLRGGATYDEKFAMLWNRLPLNDKLIARLLSAQQQQVINLRKGARKRLGRRLKNFR